MATGIKSVSLNPWAQDAMAARQLRGIRTMMTEVGQLVVASCPQISWTIRQLIYRRGCDYTPIIDTWLEQEPK